MLQGVLTGRHGLDLTVSFAEPGKAEPGRVVNCLPILVAVLELA
jgi:hypothetical protein